MKLKVYYAIYSTHIHDGINHTRLTGLGTFHTKFSAQSAKIDHEKAEMHSDYTYSVRPTTAYKSAVLPPVCRELAERHPEIFGNNPIVD